MRQFAVCVGLAVIALEPSIAELWNVTINGTTYKNVQETLPHIGVINGVVLAPDGTPAGNATVGISEEPKRISDHVFEVPTGRRLLRKKLLTNADGTFTVSHLPLSTYTVAAYVDRGRYIGSISLSADTPDHSASIRLEPALYVHGRVIDPKGNPVEGAEVAAYPILNFDELNGRQWAYPLNEVASTDRDGSFEIPAAPIAQYNIAASDEPRMATIKRSVTIDENPLELVLVPLGRIHGEVLDAETGSPLDGTNVSLCGQPNVVGSKNRTSDGDGRFLLEGAYPGRWTAIVSDYPENPGAWMLSEHPPTVDVSEAGDAHIVVKLVRRASASE